MTYRVLIIEDETVFAENIGAYLGRHGYQVRVTGDASQGLEAFDGVRPDLVLLDYRLGGVDGLEVLSEIRSRDDSAKVVLMTGHGSVDVAVQAMKAGAVDFLTKPVALGRIRRLVDRMAGVGADPGEIVATPTAEASGSEELLVGESPPMVELRARIRQLLAARRGLDRGAPPPILITGETGTGKELVARTLHRSGPRSAEPFVSINCAAIPSHLVEAELFGYERGAFTDAKSAKPGLLETADRGMLFLDEVGDLDLSVQSKLLRMLEESSVRRVGGVTERRVDVWIVSATNRPLDQRVSDGAFRADLLFRLNVLRLQTPPLQQRSGDIGRLTEYLLRDACWRWRKPALSLTEAARERLEAHDWPGNVRELRNCIEQAVVLAASGEIDVAELGLPALRESDPDTRQEARFLLPEDGLDLEVLERDFVLQALDRTEWNVTAAARLLGMSRDTLRYRMEKHGLRRAQ